MLLHEVLHTLANPVKKRKITHSKLFMILLCKEQGEPSQYEDSAKKIFANSKKNRRGLIEDDFHPLLKSDGFHKLCLSIEKKYLPYIVDSNQLCQILTDQVIQDTFMPENEKSVLINSYDANNNASISSFIALCFLCANANTNIDSGKYKASDKYPIHIPDYINGPVSELEYRLWLSSRKYFHSMRIHGARFASLNIIENILPKGHIAHLNYDAKSITKEGSSVSALELCQVNTDNISIMGDGGIGKTTLLQKIMESEFKNTPDHISPDYISGHTIPFFIELNRCPHDVSSWYDETSQKTNFISRYIASMYTDASSLYNVKAEDIATIEKEFQKTPTDGNPRYLLLLDGFNEVYSGKNNSARIELSNEISTLSRYENIRIIATSRKTQTADYASDFCSIPLIGLEKGDVLSYLKNCGYNSTQRHLISANHNLMKCLRIPLYICMFCAYKHDETLAARFKDVELPETVGEIFYNFFHHNGTFYNIKKRARDMRTNPFNDMQTAFILDFILPFIGWHFENVDTFDMSKKDVFKLIEDCIEIMQSICVSLEEIPFEEFDYDPECLNATAASLTSNNSKDIFENIIDCLQNYLGLFYRVHSRSDLDINFSNRIRYAFSHHQFRDYFSAIWDVQLLRILPCFKLYEYEKMDPENDDTNPLKGYDVRLSEYLESPYYSYSKTILISEILLEHRNKPIFNKDTGCWNIPAYTSDEQSVLSYALNYCRELIKNGTSTRILTKNIVACILAGRGELSGLDFHELDFTNTNLFNVTCSRFGSSGFLTANFKKASFSETSFEPEEHQDIIVDYQYYGDHCYTLDMSGLLKCWDTLSGNLHAQMNIGDMMRITIHTPDKYIKVSPDKRWMTIMQQIDTENGVELWLTCLDFKIFESLSKQIRIDIPHKHREITDFFFTAKSDGIVFLCDNEYVYGYCFDTITSNDHPFVKEPSLWFPQQFCQKIQLFAYSSLIQMDSIYDDSLIIFTSHYMPSEYEEFEPIDDYENISDEDLYTCELFRWVLSEKKEILLHRFSGINGYSPTVAYLPGIDAIVFYQYDSQNVGFYYCKSANLLTDLSDIRSKSQYPPSSFHQHDSNENEFYIMFPDCACLAESVANNRIRILTSTHVKTIANLLDNGGEASELIFNTIIPPDNNRFLMRLNETTYEWNASKDSLSAKYNIAYYTNVSLIPDYKRNSIVLVHQNNSISSFDGDSFKLTKSLCFNEQGYQISDACYHSAAGFLALSMTRGDHEKILIVNMISGEEKYCFSTKNPSETIISIEFHASEPILLIATQATCFEYIIDSDSLSIVRTTLPSERILGASYSNNTIEVIITPHTTEDAKKQSSRCEYHSYDYNNSKSTYQFEHYYILPELTKDIAPYLIIAQNDLGHMGPVDEHGIQDYWITEGFFLAEPPLSLNMPSIVLYSPDGEQVSSQPLRTYSPIYFRHSFNLAAMDYTKYPSPNDIRYAWLDRDSGSAVFIGYNQHICYTNNYQIETYSSIFHSLQRECSYYERDPLWEYIVPWKKHRLISSFEGYRLHILDVESGTIYNSISYSPGISVCNCDFTESDISEETKQMLQTYGALFDDDDPAKTDIVHESLSITLVRDDS